MRLRFLFFMTLSGIAVLPVIALAAWIFVDALDREIESVQDKHLVIAKNVGKALERYSIDLKNGFELVANLPRQDQHTKAVSQFMKSLEFDHLCIASLKTGAVVGSVAPISLPCPKRIPEKRFRVFVDLLEDDRIVFSPVMQSPHGHPVFYLLRTSGENLIVGAVSTKYIVKQGQAVSFGEKGHAAIVDQTGQVIAHPLPAWRKAIKNISKVAPVRRMMNRETGTAVFYSPALKADMVTGFTFVPTTGWGVMIPQPVAEIRSAATLIQNSAIGISAAGIVAAALLSWFLSGYLTRSLSLIADTSQRMAAGDYDARVGMGTVFKPKEIAELGLAFNGMADEIAKTNRDLSEAVVQADFANRAKSEFLAIMSHDLRTPLNAIIGFSDAMRNKIFGPLGDARYEDYLSDIQKSGNILLGLINDILDLSKIEAGRYELKDSDVALAAFLKSSSELATIQARQNGVRLNVVLPDDLPDLRCDERSLIQIVNNLLSNAVKFSHEGGQVSISARQVPDGKIEIEFADQGIGMAESDIKEVLEPFSQADSSKTRKYEGTGLGLHICLKFMELHGGSLDIDSEIGKGTTVIIRFPALRALPISEPADRVMALS